MRRDYFLCFFLLCIATSLLFVCFQPLYFTYDIIVPRDFGLLERLCSCTFAAAVILVIPLLAAIKRKFWITAGLACYGLLAFIPSWILPGMTAKISGSEAKLGSVIGSFCLKSIHGMVNAPFGALSQLIGDNKASMLSHFIFPMALICYAVVQLFRFYRDAYLKDKLSAQQVDPTIERGEPTNAAKPEDKEVLGTVVMAPTDNVPERKTNNKPESKKVYNPELSAKSNSSETRPFNLKQPENTGAIPLKAPESKDNTAIPADTSTSKFENKQNSVILLGAPANKDTKNSNGNVIQLGPPPKVDTNPINNGADVKTAVKPTQPAAPINKMSPKEASVNRELSPMDKMFEEFINKYESQAKRHVDEAERRQLYSKFVEMYKSQNGGASK